MMRKREIAIEARNRGFDYFSDISFETTLFKGRMKNIDSLQIFQSLQKYKPKDKEYRITAREICDVDTGLCKRQAVPIYNQCYTVDIETGYERKKKILFVFPECIRQFAARAGQITGEDPDLATITWYDNENHFSFPQRSSCEEIDGTKSIFMFFIGATRTFRIRKILSGKRVGDFKVPNGTMIMMHGQMQREFTYEVIKSVDKCDTHIAVTFQWTKRKNQ